MKYFIESNGMQKRIDNIAKNMWVNMSEMKIEYPTTINTYNKLVEQLEYLQPLIESEVCPKCQQQLLMQYAGIEYRANQLKEQIYGKQ